MTEHPQERQMEINVNVVLAEQAFDDYYRRGGQGQADDVWRRIATRFGVLAGSEVRAR